MATEPQRTHAASRTSLGTFTPFGARVFGARGRHIQRQKRSGVVSYETRGYDFIRGGLKVWFAAWGDRRDRWMVRYQVRRPPTQHELVNARQIVMGFERPDGSVDYKSKGGGLDAIR